MNSYMNVFALDNFKQINKKYYTIYYIILYDMILLYNVLYISDIEKKGLHTMSPKSISTIKKNQKN